MTDNVLSVQNIHVEFPLRQSLISLLKGQDRLHVKAVDDISFDLRQGETLGILGESGCGKSTLARAILRVIEPKSGHIVWFGKDITGWDKQQLRTLASNTAMIFQDPYSSLDPRMTVEELVLEPLEIQHTKLDKEQALQSVRAMLRRVGLLPELFARYPHELSGGQCQRVSIARALVVKPKVLICDEAVSALDVSIQAQIINMLNQLKREMNLAIIFISHDISVVRYVSDRIMVLYLGRVMETGPRADVIDRPRHPYTQALLSSIPEFRMGAHPRVASVIQGEIPSPLNPPSGCVFRTRCPKAQPECAVQIPPLGYEDGERQAACLFPG